MPLRLMRLEMGNVTSDLFTGMGSAATAKARKTVVNKVANTMTVVPLGLSRRCRLYIKMQSSP